MYRGGRVFIRAFVFEGRGFVFYVLVFRIVFRVRRYFLRFY